MMEGAQLAHWLEARCGKLTASRMHNAMAFTKKGIPAAERTDYMRELLAERLTQVSVRHYVTDAMQHGLEYEGEAINEYEVETGSLVQRQPGFFDHPRIQMCGASPDGLVGSDGLVEAKCPTTVTFIAWRLAGCIPEERKPQMALQLASTGRKWCDFVAYDPRIQDPKLRLFIRRYEPTAEEIAAVEAAAEDFLRDLDRYWDLLIEAA
jgi:predicted phage-related endonuclease